MLAIDLSMSFMTIPRVLHVCACFPYLRLILFLLLIFSVVAKAKTYLLAICSGMMIIIIVLLSRRKIVIDKLIQNKCRTITERPFADFLPVSNYVRYNMENLAL